ncbi:hypothetical protein CTI12_AA043740 [Artemisia annua]|uniref:Uncharacterized protein n=1 Tax=Artemisia annua TaxID=35608 RepID=A0A2U1Q7P0_ARTAN|nr:hypothetical protein CTI12_AA043740 [Artemisia annua]
MASSSSEATNNNKRPRSPSPPKESFESSKPTSKNRYRIYGIADEAWERQRKLKIHDFEFDMIESYTSMIKKLEDANEVDENYIFGYKEKIKGRNETIKGFKKNIEQLKKRIEDVDLRVHNKIKIHKP